MQARLPVFAPLSPGVSLPKLRSYLNELGLEATPSMAQLEHLPPKRLAHLVSLAVEADVPSPRLFERLAKLCPEQFHRLLGGLDPAGPFAHAFDRAPFAEIAHWAEELQRHQQGLPQLDQGRPADTLAAALMVLGRSGRPRSFHVLERWLEDANEEQLEAARHVLAAVGVGVARGRRVVDQWSLPAYRLQTSSSPSMASVEAREIDGECLRCGERLVEALTLDASLFPDLAVRRSSLAVTVCPRCLAAGSISYVQLARGGPRSAADLAGPILDGDSAPDPIQLPRLGPVNVTACSRHDDSNRPDRTSLHRIGGAPCQPSPLIAMSPLSGEPMIFVAQLATEAGLLLAWYCSEDSLLAAALCLEQ